jgi:hypothetical protein
MSNAPVSRRTPLPFPKSDQANACERQCRSGPGAGPEPLAQDEHRETGRHDRIRIDDEAGRTGRDGHLTHVQKGRIESHEQNAADRQTNEIRQARPSRARNGEKERSRHRRNGKPQSSQLNRSESLQPGADGRKSRGPGKDRDDDGCGGYTVEGLAFRRTGSTDAHSGIS